MQWVAQFISLDSTLGTEILLTSRHKTLLGMVHDVCSEDWVDTSNPLICADDFNTILPSFNERRQDGAHAFMEEPIAFKRLSTAFGEALQFGYWFVAD